MRAVNAYKKLLVKMFFFEEIGMVFYESLKLKAKDDKLQAIYHQLYLNEKNTAQCIEKEIMRLDNKAKFPKRNFQLWVWKIFFSLLPVFFLHCLLNVVLSKKPYRRWAGIYIDKNREFWDILVKHENEECRILGMEG